MRKKKEISATLEDYLEAILKLIHEKGSARVRDISSELSVHKSTVTAALKSLSEKGLVNYTPYEITTLSPKGKKIAKEIVQRHKIIQRFLSDVLCIKDSIAKKNACRMEHVMDKEVLDRLVLFAEFAKQFPIKNFPSYFKRKKEKKTCR